MEVGATLVGALTLVEDISAPLTSARAAPIYVLAGPMCTSQAVAAVGLVAAGLGGGVMTDSMAPATRTGAPIRTATGRNEVRPISDRAMAIFFAILVAIVVLGYLLMTKLADDTRAEHCMMAHGKNCGAMERPSD